MHRVSLIDDNVDGPLYTSPNRGMTSAGNNAAQNGSISEQPPATSSASSSDTLPTPTPSVLQQPPLPADPPPSIQHSQHSQHPQHPQHPQHAAQSYSNAHFGRPVLNWKQEGFVVHHNPDIPPISNLLLHEADAWRAVLSLHSSTITTAQRLSRSPDNKGDATLHPEDEKTLNSQSREAAYCAALSSLASQCDALFNEVLKLRTLRKARHKVEVEAITDVVRAHSDEVLAIGQTLASNGSLNVSSATADLRIAIQNQRNQISQLRVFLDCVKMASNLPLPQGSKLVVGVKREGSEHDDVRELDELFAHIYETSRDVNEMSLVDALAKMFVATDTQSIRRAGPESRQFSRRTEDRASA